MANFTKTINYKAGNKVVTLSSSDTYEEMVNYELMVDDTDGGIKLLSVDPESRATSEDWSNVKSLCVQCVSRQPIEVVFKTKTWTDDTTQSGSDYFHTILTEGQMISIPNARMISYNDSGNSAGNGTALSLPVANTAVDTGLDTANTASADLTDTDITLDGSGAAVLEVGDRIMFAASGGSYSLGDEICEVVKVDGTALTIKRGQIFTAVDAVANNDDIFFYWITDENGNLNWRSNTHDIDAGGKIFGNSFSGGIVPGTLGIRFYTKGTHSLGMSSQTASSSTGLTASTAYRLKVTIDARDYDNIEFTTDSSNVNWGGSNGVLSKIQTAFNDNSVPATVALLGGDIVFTSKLGTKAGSIVLAAPSGGTSIFGVGNVPAATNLGAQTVSTLDLDYGDDDFSQSKLMYDDGKGNLYRASGGSGTVNYDTGQIKMVGAPTYSQFIVTFASNSPLDGKLKLDATNNYIEQVSARSLNTKKDGKVKVVGYY